MYVCVRYCDPESLDFGCGHATLKEVLSVCQSVTLKLEKLKTRIRDTVYVSLWILGTTRTFFILLQVSFQFGMVHMRMNQDQNIKKYFLEPFLRKITFL